MLTKIINVLNRCELGLMSLTVFQILVAITKYVDYKANS